MGERRIGAFGGTFDPVHNGHVEVVRTIVRSFALDQLLIIPAHRPPHKGSRAIAGEYHRFTMAVLASLDQPRVLVSTIELETPERPYTFETIESLRTAFGPDTRLFFIMGADSFEEVNTWREPARLLSSTNVIVITRPGHDVGASHLDDRFRSTIVDLRGRDGDLPAREDSKAPRIYLTDNVNIEVSSTEIRQRVRDGQSIEDSVPPHVADYIRKYELYRR
ncbi:MAG TPA: nicotinate-nucleotide adenylyltransferase [Blastocatellia bacterium]|nr:nicotinate-nucleotide adenylyltransferase [Blastocatellia bacterium]